MKLILLTIASISVIALNSCNTTVGLGRDLRLLGEGMEKTADKSLGGGAEANSGAPVY